MSVLAFRRLPWPWPAFAAWLLAWAAYRAAGGDYGYAAALLIGVAAASCVDGRRRRLLVAAGFPVSALALGAVPAWSWLAAVAPLLMVYPLRAWRDAPFFPTPAAALQGLDRVIRLAPGARVLDAGCGLGDGLIALRRVWPDARADGVEWSRPLAWVAALRCRRATIRRGDMWAASWAGYDLVYLFQRPESMARAWAKAEAEMAPASWLVSLEFAVPGRAPQARVDGGARPLFVYRIDGCRPANSGSTARGRRR